MNGTERRVLILLIAFIIGLVFYVYRDFLSVRFFQPAPDNVRSGVTISPTENTENIEIVAQNLTIPWEMAILPDGDLLATERDGALYRLSDGKRIIVPGVNHVGEGGLLGLALHPDFAQNNFLYLYLTSAEGGKTINRVERYKFAEGVLTEKIIIIGGIPGSSNHDGGRMEFGPDKFLYITTGDASQSNLAQDIKSLAGKILRVKDDGSLPADNPFNNAVYSYGHRNPQGLAWDERGRLWAMEHGRSGLLSGLDEINLIEKGANYGWPAIQGDETRAGMKSPMAHSGANETWAPGDAVFYDGRLFFTGLRGESLYEAVIDDTKIAEIKKHFTGQWGRLRALRLGSDGWFYVSTSNKDGRGTMRDGDDKIIKINPAIFNSGITLP